MAARPLTRFASARASRKGVFTISSIPSRNWRRRRWTTLGRNGERNWISCFRPWCRRWNGCANMLRSPTNFSVKSSRNTAMSWGVRFSRSGPKFAPRKMHCGKRSRKSSATNASIWNRRFATRTRLGLVNAPDADSQSVACSIAYYEGLLTQARIENDVEFLRDTVSRLVGDSGNQGDRAGDRFKFFCPFI